MVKNYKDRDWLYDAYINKGFTTRKIAEICEAKSKTTIINWLKKLDIPTREPSQIANHVDLSFELRQEIEGHLLGDGNLNSPHERSARYVHASKFCEYVTWIAKRLQAYGIEGIIYPVNINEKTYWHYTSKCYYELLEIMEQWYTNGNKHVPKNINLTPWSCLLWLLDDGGLSYNKTRKIVELSTHAFIYEEVKRIAIQLEQKADIKTHVYKYKKGPFIRIHDKESVANFYKYLPQIPQELKSIFDYKWPKIRVLASGVYDLPHIGHIRILKRAKALGDYLIVSVNTDRKAEAYKRKPVFPEDQRLEIIQSIRYVDLAFLLDEMDFKPSILKYRINLIVHGDDCTREKYLRQIHISEKWLLEHDVKLTLLPYTPNVSTTITFINHGEKYKRLQRRGSC